MQVYMICVKILASFVKGSENRLKSNMKNLLIVIWVALFALTGCDNPLKKSGKKPSKSELKAAIFKGQMPFLTFYQFEPNFEDNPEKAKENRYQVYVDAEISYSEPLYEGCPLVDPMYYRQKGLEDLVPLCIANSALKRSGEKGLSPVLWKIHEKGERFKIKILADISKTEKQWICTSWEQLSGKELEGNPAALFSSTCLVWGSPEHLAELNHYGIKFPGGNL